MFIKINNKYKNGEKMISVEELIEASIRSIQEIEVDEDIAAPMQNYLVWKQFTTIYPIKIIFAIFMKF